MFYNSCHHLHSPNLYLHCVTADCCWADKVNVPYNSARPLGFMQTFATKTIRVMPMVTSRECKLRTLQVVVT